MESAEEKRMMQASSESTQLPACPKLPGFGPAPFYCVPVRSTFGLQTAHGLRVSGGGVSPKTPGNCFLVVLTGLGAAKSSDLQLLLP